MVAYDVDGSLNFGSYTTALIPSGGNSLKAFGVYV